MNNINENYINLTLLFILFFLVFVNYDNFGNCTENNHLGQNEINNYNNRNFDISGTNKYFETKYLPQKASCCKKNLGNSITDNDRVNCNCSNN